MINSHHLAQINIAKFKAELNTHLMHGFTSRLDEINALADESPGFIWRFQTEDGDATSVRPYDDPLMLVNMSVWTDMESFKAFVYKSRHAELLAARKQWVTDEIKPHFAMWWLPAGNTPTLQDGMARLQLLKQNGDTPTAFGFRKPFPPPG